MLTKLLSELQNIPHISYKEHAPMKDYTSFQIGGPADVLIQPENIDAFLACRKILQKTHIPCHIIGAGSNLLVGDKGVRGAVIRLSKPFNTITREGNNLIADAGVSLARLAAFALEAGLSGLEFASGIPGTLGGAVYMNAGAYGGEMKDVVTETLYVDAAGNLLSLKGNAHEFGYRKSFFSWQDAVILRSTITLTPSDPEQIRATMQDLNNRRREKQPLTYPSAGSTFKRPEGHFAGQLIEEAGLKGFSVGGACVSEKHAGFVVNTGNATAKDVRTLMELITQKVQEKFGVTLEPEVRFLGEF
ncbi:MAG: UDP-N-acetylmuramate dehydrogenase [Clostridia bacterium]|nr:UDP-N-acetylmuramate dehydrogenase [Clostridia bacterium]